MTYRLPAAAILADETLATFETRRLSVIEEGSEDIGRTVETADGAEVRVAVSADGPRFEREFLSTLNAGMEVTIAPRARWDRYERSYNEPEGLPPGIWRLSGAYARSPTGEFYAQGNRM
jgi:hypothetical protein